MAKKKTLEELNALVASLAEQYKQSEKDLADAFIATGDGTEAQEEVRKALATTKNRLWREYSKAKRQQVNARQEPNQQRRCK